VEGEDSAIRSESEILDLIGSRNRPQKSAGFGNRETAHTQLRSRYRKIYEKSTFLYYFLLCIFRKLAPDVQNIDPASWSLKVIHVRVEQTGMGEEN
jgi:hypothetical protein